VRVCSLSAYKVTPGGVSRAHGLPGDVFAVPLGDRSQFSVMPTIVLHFHHRGVQILLSVSECNYKYEERADQHAIEPHRGELC
jgi:hypothetical protein